MNESGVSFEPLLIVLIVVLACAFAFIFVEIFTNFTQELKYINMEIRRSSDRERKYWVRKRRKLLLSLIPFVKK